MEETHGNKAINGIAATSLGHRLDDSSKDPPKTPSDIPSEEGQSN